LVSVSEKNENSDRAVSFVEKESMVPRSLEMLLQRWFSKLRDI